MLSKRQHDNKFSPKLYMLGLALILSLAAFNVFHNLKSTPIDSWDEARHGVSAYEMLKNKDLIVNTFAFKNDYWNLKPPISFWAICVGYKAAGYNPLGLRLFSALAALFTILIIAFYTRYTYGRLASLISALILTTTTQYILSHSARTGDADSLHVLFFTSAMLCTALSEKRRSWLYLAGFFFSLSFLTKSWHAGSIPVIIFLYLLFGGFLFKINIRQWLALFTSSVFPILTWGIFRFSKDGLAFFKGMINFDLLARSSKVLEGHTGGPPYYLLTLQYNYSFWALILIGAFIIYLFLFAGTHKTQNKGSSLLIFFWIAVPLIFYTYAKTKITWYVLPLYPPLAVCIGVLSSKIILAAKRNAVLSLAIIVGILVTSFTYEKTIIAGIIQIKPEACQYAFSQMGRDRKFKDSHIYIMDLNKEYPTCWMQCDLLAAELYGDLKPMDGGIASFMNDNENPLIILPDSDKYRKLIMEKGLKIIMEDGTNLILQK